MEGVRKIMVDGKEILIIDYSDCKEAEMIDRLLYAKDLVLLENKPVLLLSIFNDKCYATPPFVRQSEAAYDEVRQLIQKSAIIGLSGVQRMILKGFTLLGNRTLKEFASFDDAVRFLTED